MKRLQVEMGRSKKAVGVLPIVMSRSFALFCLRDVFLSGLTI